MNALEFFPQHCDYVEIIILQFLVCALKKIKYNEFRSFRALGALIRFQTLKNPASQGRVTTTPLTLYSAV
jgi:hypothetical protein